MEDQEKSLSFGNDAYKDASKFQSSLLQGTQEKASNLNANLGAFNYTAPTLLNISANMPSGEGIKPVLDMSPTYAKQKKLAFNKEAQNIERYTSHPAYSRLGFSTLRDNESFYNANTSWTGDFVRASKYFFPVMGEVFLDNFGGGLRMFGNPGTLDPSNINPNKGDLMTHSAKMAMSTRGGLGQSVVNIGYNMNYTLGIISAIAAEDLLLALVAPETFGSSLTYAGVRTVKGFGKAVKGTFQTLKNVDKLRDALSAQQLYNKMSAAGNAVARSFVPNSYNFIRGATTRSTAATNAGRAGDAIASLATLKGFGAVYRDLRIAGLANDESMVEAAGVRDGLRDKLINEYVAANGFMPSGEILAEMDKEALQAGNVDYWANLPFIYLTNNITFNSLALPYGNAAKTMKVRAGKAKNVYSTITRSKVKGAADKGLKEGIGLKVTAQELSRSQAFVKMFTDADMRRYAMGTLGSYFAANISEGVQEIYQESASKAIEEYFSTTYLRPDMAGMKLAKKEIAGGLAAQISQQGLEAFLGGFLGGGIIAGGGNIIQAGTEAIGSGYRKVNKSALEKYEAALEKDKKFNSNLVELINKEGADVVSALAPELVTLKAQANAQKGMSIALELNDRMAFETIKDESLFTYISALAQKGIVDNFLTALDNHKQLSDEELLQAIPAKDRAAAEKVIDDIIKRTKSIVATQAYVDNRYGNYYADALMDPTITGEERKELQVAAAAFELAKQTLVYSYHNNQRTLERLVELSEAAAADPAVASMLSSDITPLFNLSADNKTLSFTLESEIKRIKEEKAALTSQLANLNNAAVETEEDKAVNEASKRETETQLSDTTKRLGVLSAYEQAFKKFKAGLKASKGRSKIESVDGYKELSKALTDVLNYYADKSGSAIDGLKAEKLLEQIVDYNRIEELNTAFTQAVSNLSSPENFRTFFGEISTQLSQIFQKNIMDQFRALDAASVEKRKDLLEDLADIGVVIPNESITDPSIPESESSLFKFVNDGVIPTVFLGDPKSDDVDLQGRVIEGSETWQKIQDIFERYDMLKKEAAEDLEEKVNGTKEEEAPQEPAETTQEEPEAVEEGEPVQEERIEEKDIEAEFKVSEPEIYEQLIKDLNEEWKKYRQANPKERISTLSMFMNGPGRQVSLDLISKARAAAEGYAAVEEPVVENIEEGMEGVQGTITFPDPENVITDDKEFNRLKRSIARTKKQESLEALEHRINSNTLLSLDQKIMLQSLLEARIAKVAEQNAEKEGVTPVPTPTITEEVNEDVDSSTEGLDEAKAKKRFEQDDVNDPFADDDVC